MTGSGCKALFYSLLLLLAAGWHARSIRAAVRVLRPRNCATVRSGQSPLVVQFEVDDDEDSKNDYQPRILIRSSQFDEVWWFDVPPDIAFTTTHVACPSVERPPPVAGLPGTDSGLKTLPGGQCVAMDSFNGMDSSTDGVRRWQAQVPYLEPGYYLLQIHVLKPFKNITILDQHADVVIRAVQPESGARSRSSLLHQLGAAWAHLETRMNAKLREVEAEMAHLRTLHKKTMSRYHPLTRNMQSWPGRKKVLHPPLAAALEAGNVSGIAALVSKVADGVFLLPVLQQRVAAMLRDEIDYALSQASTLQFMRPNTMNRHGFVLEEVGMGEWADGLMREVLSPLACTLLPEWGGCSIDHHHTFTLKYSLGGDEDLSRHMDLAEVTLNLGLGANYQGGKLVFQGRLNGALEDEEVARLRLPEGGGVLHVGRQWHSVDQLEAGQRYNLVMWGRSTLQRSSSAEVFVRACKRSSDHQPDEL